MAIHVARPEGLGCAFQNASIACRSFRSGAHLVKTFTIKGSVAVVTGAGGGIGRALAVDLASRGASLALTDRDAATLVETAALCRASSPRVSEHVFDMANALAIAALPDAVVAEHGHVDLVINNAGVALAGDFDQIGLDDFEWLMAINFWGPVRMCKAFLPLLRQRPAAHIVNISSLFGIIKSVFQRNLQSAICSFVRSHGNPTCGDRIIKSQVVDNVWCLVNNVFVGDHIYSYCARPTLSNIKSYYGIYLTRAKKNCRCDYRNKVKLF